MLNRRHWQRLYNFLCPAAKAVTDLSPCPTGHCCVLQILYQPEFLAHVIEWADNDIIANNPGGFCLEDRLVSKT
jgi:hypothetical protein